MLLFLSGNIPLKSRVLIVFVVTLRIIFARSAKQTCHINQFSQNRRNTKSHHEHTHTQIQPEE